MIRARACIALVLFVAVARRVEARGCSETSDIEGLRHCGQFGSFDAASRPRLMITLAGEYRPLAFRAFDLSGGAEGAGQSVLFHVHGSDLGLDRLDVAAGEFSVRVFLGPHLYLGGVAFVGGAHIPSMQIPVGGVARFQTGDLFEIGAGPLTGLAFALGPIAFRAELATLLRFTWMPGTLWIGEFAPEADIANVSLLVEPRVAIDAFAGPHWSLSVFAGVDVVPDLAVFAGVAFQAHVRSFNGAFAPPH